MRVRLAVFSLLAITLPAQPPPPPNLDVLIHEVRSAIEKADLTTASDIAAKLDAAVHQQFQTWLIRDAKQRVDEVLTWLPEDSETLMVYQEPFVISAKDTPADFDGHPARLYATDRLLALDGGKFYAALNGLTVRLVAVGMRDIRARFPGFDTTSTPAPLPQTEAAYFYFLDRPLDMNTFDALARDDWGLARLVRNCKARGR